ncbi:terminase [Nocardioides sp. Leaf374]|uniref:terminase n=1 Tax=Nocardioides sp. Leaf374 TaxID=2876560 RepID=UPI001E3EC4B3|nr:terminase [Nocardioides sp. Leaf374]
MWLPSPPPGTGICAGFDGSESDDWTAIKAETREGLIFTPRWGPDRRPTVWNPKDYDGHIPRSEVFAAWVEIVETYDLRQAFCDPGFHDETSWASEIDQWAARWGEDRFLEFPTTSLARMFPAIRRFEADLSWITHDGCPITITHMRNARKLISRGGRTYTLGKPAAHQKIDAAVTSILAHEAASAERAAGWLDRQPAGISNVMYGFS